MLFMLRKYFILGALFLLFSGAMAQKLESNKCLAQSKNKVDGIVGNNKNVILTPSNDVVILDGKLDDPLWKNAVKLSPFRVLGNVSQTTSVDNEVMIAIKGDALYIAYRLEEPNIKAMKTSKKSSLAIYADDCVETFISTDKKRYAHFIVNAAAIKYGMEKKTSAKTSTICYFADKSEYKGNWEARAWCGDNEWTVEIRIKLSDLVHKKKIGGEQQIFVNFTRHRTQGKEPNQTLVAVPGKKYLMLNDFMPITLKLPIIDQQ
jgi:Carbohydrate family 9 binding domain-like